MVGGMHGWQGVCMVAGGCAWLLGERGGACIVAGGMRGCWGACVVAGGHVWLPGDVWLPGGHAWLWGACVVAGGACIGHDEIRSMNCQYPSYWNAFSFNFVLKSGL